MNGTLADRSIYLDLSPIPNHKINGAGIAKALTNAGFGLKTQAVIPLRKDGFQIVAVDIISAHRLLSTGLDIDGHHLDLKDELGLDTVYVTVRGLPLDFPITETSSFLEQFGKIKSPVRPEKWQGTNILTGGHVARMTISKAIPGRVEISGVKALVFYKNQPKVCFKCNKPGHLAKECSLHTFNKPTTDASHTSKSAKQPDLAVESSPMKTAGNKSTAAGTPVKSSSSTKPPTSPKPEDSPSTKLVIDEGKKIDDDDDDDEGHKTDASTTSKRALSPSSSNVDSDSDCENTPMNTPVKHKKKTSKVKRRKSPKHR